MKTKVILLLEDNEGIQAANRRMLELHNYTVETALDLAGAREVLERVIPDLIVADIMLPDGSGLDFVREIRESTAAPILFLTAMGEKEDIIAGLRAGGDDYLSKPYDYNELLARIEAQLRRVDRMSEEARAHLYVGGIILNCVSRRAMLEGADLLLKPKEFAVLEILALNMDRFVPSTEIYEQVWGALITDDIRTVTVHISKLRQKLKTQTGVHIESERGEGYRLRLQP